MNPRREWNCRNKPWIYALGLVLVLSGCISINSGSGGSDDPEYLILRGTISRKEVRTESLVYYQLKTDKDTYVLHPSKNISVEELEPFSGKSVVVFGAFVDQAGLSAESLIPPRYTGLVFQAFDIKE